MVKNIFDEERSSSTPEASHEVKHIYELGKSVLVLIDSVRYNPLVGIICPVNYLNH